MSEYDYIRSMNLQVNGADSELLTSDELKTWSCADSRLTTSLISRLEREVNWLATRLARARQYDGHGGFYTSPTAEMIIEEMRNAIEAEDRNERHTL